MRAEVPGFDGTSARVLLHGCCTCLHFGEGQLADDELRHGRLGRGGDAQHVQALRRIVRRQVVADGKRIGALDISAVVELVDAPAESFDQLVQFYRLKR